MFSIDDGKITAEGHVLRLEPGSGIAVQFTETTRGDWGDIHRVMEYVQNTSSMYDNRYVQNLLQSGKKV